MASELALSDPDGTQLSPAGASPWAIQLPPLSSSKGGPPQRTRQVTGKATRSRLWHAPLKRRIPKGPSHRPEGNGYGPGLTPRNLM